MQNFEFYNPTRIVFGKNQISKLSSLMPQGRVLLLYGQGSVKSNGVYDEVMKSLSKNEVYEVSGVTPNPTYEKAIEALKVIKDKKIDFILAIGGGSVIDTAKFLSLATYFEGEPWNILTERGLDFKRALPFGCVLTLPATGSEMNCFYVLSKGNQKLSGGHPLLFPQFSILDPEKTFTLDHRQVANGVVDAYVHVLEQYLTFDNKASLQDRFAESVLKTLIEVGPVTYKNPNDYDARANHMWCATMALSSVFGVGVAHDWSTHMIGHELTALYNIDHARSLAVVLPSLMHFMKKEKEEKLIQYAREVWGLAGEKDQVINDVINKTVAFFESLGVPTKLSAYEVDKNVAEIVVNRFLERGIKVMGESRAVTMEKVKLILNHSMS